MGYRAIAIFATMIVVAIAWFAHLAGLVTLPKFISPDSKLHSMLIWLPIFAGQFYIILNLRRLKRRLRQADGHLCPMCAYDLSGVATPGSCPECGTPFDAQKIRQAWKDVDWKR